MLLCFLSTGTCGTVAVSCNLLPAWDKKKKKLQHLTSRSLCPGQGQALPEREENTWLIQSPLTSIPLHFICKLPFIFLARSIEIKQRGICSEHYNGFALTFPLPGYQRGQWILSLWHTCLFQTFPTQHLSKEAASNALSISIATPSVFYIPEALATNHAHFLMGDLETARAFFFFLFFFSAVPGMVHPSHPDDIVCVCVCARVYFFFFLLLKEQCQCRMHKARRFIFIFI